MLFPRTLCRAFSSVVPSIINQSISETVSSSNNLTDKFGRKHTYLRISLTERCNLRCTYCMPEEGVELTPNQKLLTSQEIIRLAGLFASHGVQKIRLTGSIAKIQGIKDVGLTSNGIVLDRKLDALLEVGLTQLNISLDTLDEGKYMVISRRNGFQKNLDIRFIEYMPFGGNSFALQKMVSYKELLLKISHKFPQIIRLDDPSNSTSKVCCLINYYSRIPPYLCCLIIGSGVGYGRNRTIAEVKLKGSLLERTTQAYTMKGVCAMEAYKIKGFKGQFGFITSMSQHFCDTCNRLRITADGNLKVCLHGNAEVSLRDEMRSGVEDNQLSTIISEAVSRKKAQHAGVENLMKMTNRPMILIDAFQPVYVLNSLLYKSILSSFVFNHLIHCYTKPLSLNSTNLLFSIRKYSTKTLFSHLDSHGTANMVDTSHKLPSTRIALAEAVLQFQASTFSQLLKSNGQNAKGDIFSVSRIAGICGAKRTSELIPLCHPISLSHVSVRFKTNQQKNQLLIYCRVKSVSATGVEMEALTACSIAALTIYDMCKALSHDIVIGAIRLLGKAGGKEDFGCVEFSPDSDVF